MIQVLIVDDQAVVRQALKALLGNSSDIEVVGEAADGVEAVRRAVALEPDVVLMDLSMPHFDGLKAAQAVRHNCRSQVIILTVHYDEELVKRATRKGVFAYLLKTASRGEIVTTIRRAAQRKSQERSRSGKCMDADGLLWEINEGDRNVIWPKSPQSSFDFGGRVASLPLLSSLQIIVAAVEAKDVYTYGHSQKVAYWTARLGECLGFDRQRMHDLYLASAAHDVGKLKVPDRILLKSGFLTQEEWEHIYAHPIVGAELLESAGFKDGIIKAVRHHHERWDGQGYPDGLKGNDIPLEARLIAVADTYDALVSTRPYRESLSSASAQAEIKRVAGTQLDASLVDLMLECLVQDEDRNFDKNVVQGK